MTDDMRLPIEGADYFVVFMELPPKIWAFIRLNSDGTYTMYFDPRRSWEQMWDSYEHELWHIIRDDFYNGEPIWIVESA